MSLRAVIRSCRGAAFAVLCAFAGGCAVQTERSAVSPSSALQTSAPQATATEAATPLPVVSDPPASAERPTWISELSPRGEAAVGAQIRIRFASDVVPVEMLEAPDRQAALAHVEIAPKLPGRFVFVTPRMIVFAAEKALPTASRIVVTLRAGLADLKGHSLDSDLAYSFTTKAVKVTLADESSGPAQGPRPRVVANANVRLDESSLVAHAKLQAPDGTEIPLVIARASPVAAAASTATPESSTSFEADQSTAYTLVPDRDVALNTAYAVRVDAGVLPSYGNLATTADTTTKVRTYGPFTYTGLTLEKDDDVARPLESGNPKLTFTNDIDPKTVVGALTISPAPKRGFAQFALAGPAEIAINANALQPRTRYTVSVAPTLHDRFGQVLDRVASVSFMTGALTPVLWAPSDFAIFPSTLAVALNVATANLPNDRYRARFVKLSPTDVVSTDVQMPEDLAHALGKNAMWPARKAPVARDVERTTGIALAPALGGPTGLLAYGVAAEIPRVGLASLESEFTGAVEVTNVGVFAQWFPTGGFVRAHRLSDGAPIAHATVDVYESKPSAAGAPVPCASGRTDPTGTATFVKSALQACLSVAKSDDQAPALVAIVHDRSDWAFARTSTYGQSLGDASYASWSAGFPHARGGFVSDRELYQRGETAYFTGFGFFEVAGSLVHGASHSYAVVAKSPQGKIIALGSHTLDAFGSFDVHTLLAKDADLGDWTIAATGMGGEAFTGTFTVAEFKPPTFKVALALDAHVAAVGDVVHATTTSAYLFGAPLARGTEHVAVTRSQSAFVPKGYESFSYGPQYSYPEEPPTLDANVSESDVTTDSSGKSAVAVTVARDLPYPADYRVDGEVKDVSNLAVSDSQTFTALPSRTLVVLRGETLGTAKQPYGFDFAVVDPAGHATPGTNVHFTLARRIDDRATQIVEGSETPHDSVHYQTVAEFDATSSAAVQRLRTLADRGGEYRLRANLAHASSEATATDLVVYVMGDDAQWYPAGDTTLHVKLDKALYKSGETAHALIASPYSDAELSFAVIRNGALVRRVVRVHGASANVAFTITPAMLPNAVVEAVLVRQGAPLRTPVAPATTDLSRAGFASLHVALDAKYVKITAHPKLASLAPGATQHVALHVVDGAGRPLQAEITLAVANDAVLQLSGYRFPDFVKQLYADLPISTRYSDNRVDVKLAPEMKSVEKGFGYGGGALAGPASTRVRTKFRPIAYFDGSVRTDAHGDAVVSFALPDDLTTWRVLALARTRDARFGTTDSTFVATKPLVTTPMLPQFARPGDILEGGVSVTNVSATKPGIDAGDINVGGTLSGALAFLAPENAASQNTSTAAPATNSASTTASTNASTSATSTSASNSAASTSTLTSVTSSTSSSTSATSSANTTTSATTTQKLHFAGPTAGYRFAMLVRANANDAATRAVPDARVTFRTALAGATDAFAVSLPIVTDDVLESVVDTGTTTGTASVPLTVDAALPNDAGGLHITLASTLLGNTLAPLDAALAGDGPPFGFGAAGRIAIAADRILLERRYGSTADVPQLLKRIASERETLRTLARDDGSYAFFPGGSSDPYTTAFVAIQLVQARRAGVDVSAELAKLHTNLLTVLADPTRDGTICKSDICVAEARLEALETLAPLGDVRSDHLSDIYDLRAQFSYYERVELARHLVRLPQWRARGLALRDKLLEQLNESGRFAKIVEQGDFGETPIDGQAQLLGLMIETNVAADRIDRAFSSLLAARGRDGTWGCTCDDAEALNAVVLYAARDRVPPDFTATARIGGGTAFAQRFEGYRITQVTHDTAMANLPRGKSTLALERRGTGTLHYTVDFDYAIRGASAGTYQGIRIDRIVRPAGGTGDPIATYGLAAPSQPLTIEAGQVFDIEDRITTDHPLASLVVADSLAAGFEAIDTRFATNSAHVFESLADWNIDYQTIERSRVVTYARVVQPGVYAFHYLVRSVTPGTYAWPSARASLALAPDEFGRTAAGTLIIK